MHFKTNTLLFLEVIQYESLIADSLLILLCVFSNWHSQMASTAIKSVIMGSHSDTRSTGVRVACLPQAFNLSIIVDSIIFQHCHWNLLPLMLLLLGGGIILLFFLL